MVRILLAVIFMLCCEATRAAERRSDTATADGVELQISAEIPESGLMVQEMAVITISAMFRDPLNLFSMDSSVFTNARALQLGKDQWSLEGVSTKRLSRRIAVFPQKSGPLAIGPFHLDATLTTVSGGRREVRLDTPPLSIAVAKAPQESTGWWLPVRSLSVKDEWEPDPQDIPVDGLAHRTVTLEALGALGDQLPPAPMLRSPPIVTFARQESRETVLTPEGPVGRVIYRWDVRAAHEEPSLLQGIAIPWFDTGSRQVTEARIPERRVAERLLLVKEESDSGSMLRKWLDWRAIATGGAFGLLVLLTMAGLHRWSRQSSRMSEIWHAAMRGDASSMRLAISRLTSESHFTFRVETTRLIAQLDAHLYAPRVAACPPLKRLAKSLAKESRNSFRSAGLPRRSGLQPLDGAGSSRRMPT